ncbi:hypothetical protein BHS06_28985 [Myxococcus xanthus]|nr:hypothetical protein BHS06_28985 [Myxococcus xanthus]
MNHKRAYRLMRQGRLLLQRHTGKPTRTHDGLVVTLKSNAPHPVEWLSDNGPVDTAKDTRDFGCSLGLRVCTTPSYSPRATGWPRPS